MGILNFGYNKEQTHENKDVCLCHVFAILWLSICSGINYENTCSLAIIDE